jgi:Tfp pilus assembly protein PilO
MESLKPSPRPVITPAAQRLLLAVAASTVILALGWAGLRVRTQQAQIRQLESNLKQREKPSDTPAVLLPELKQQLAEAIEKRKQAEAAAAARETELQGVITFLRSELKSANEALDRLKQQMEKSLP